MTHVHIIAGPTASGKTAFALDKAQSVACTIINADSVQLYDVMPVLTARPTAEEQAQAPHKLFGILSPEESCSAERWRGLALDAIYDAARENRLPILVGGTGFYLKALLEGFSPIPDIDPAVRKLASAEQERLGNPGFYEELAKRDPAISDKLHPNDTQRLIRAWEVFEATGKSITHWQSLPPSGPPDGMSFEIDIILPPRETLHRKINARFDQMIEQGALEEVKELAAMIADGLVPLDAEIVKAHGFRPLRAYLNGEISFEDAAEHTKAETRQYAKRQTTWLRHQIKAEGAVKNINIIESR